MIGLSSYGPAVTKFRKLDGSETFPRKNYGEIIAKAISRIIWDQEEIMLENVKGYENELQYVNMLKSSLGFGILILRNASFNKIYTVGLRNREISKKINCFCLFYQEG